MRQDVRIVRWHLWDIRRYVVGYIQGEFCDGMNADWCVQGAQVIGDVMCGTSEANFNSTPPLNPALSKNIIAIIQMGDPTHIPNLPQDVGNSTKAGIFPRPNTTACAAMEPITKSFCSADDRFCDSGNSIPVHLSYVREFGVQAKDFVVSKAMNGTRKA